MGKPVVNEHQPSITEWFAAIGERARVEALRREDNAKSDRLETLYQRIGLPYARPVRFSARELADRSTPFTRYLAAHGDELCAIRLVPRRDDLPKLRQRGQTLRECYEQWFRQQRIDPDAYQVEVCPHVDTLEWSTIFVVSESGVFGEVVAGMHFQLTHGTTYNPLGHFRFDFRRWTWSSVPSEARRLVHRMVHHLQVSPAVQPVLRRELAAEFSQDYLLGYFEAVVWGGAIYFNDYNRVLRTYVGDAASLTVSAAPAPLTGVAAVAGVARGPVVIVHEGNLGTVDFPDGSILVCDNTDVRYLPYMRKASAIITNRGGILSHAAIIARELKKPCIIGAQNATQVLKGGDHIAVDASTGVVRKL